MLDDKTTEFSGIGGRVLRQNFSVLALINGTIIGIVLLLGSWFFMQWEEAGAATLYFQIVVALVLARFALNGVAGEWRGTVISTVGGSWIMAAQVAVRYLVLSAVWVAPLLLFGLDFGQAGAELGGVMAGAGGGIKIALASIYVLGMILTPPIFLIASVSAESFNDLMTTAHWGQLFKGRLGDLYFIYVVYIGGVLTAMGLLAPVVVMGFGAGMDAGVTVLGFVLLFVGGLAMSLLGRLCGFYAFGETGSAGFAPTFAQPSSAAPSPRSAPGAPRIVPAAAASAAPRAAAPAGSSSHAVPVAPAAGGTPAASGARAAATPSPAQTGAASVPIATGSTGPAAAGSPSGGSGTPAVAPVKPMTPSGKPALMDARARIEEAQRRFAQDPQGAVSALEEVRASHAPSPPLLQALCLMYQKAGQTGLAIEVAHEALPMCFDRGQIGPATEIFRALFMNLKELPLNRDQILAIAGNLLKTNELNVAAQAYGVIVRTDTGERRAIKGLLQVADRKLQDSSTVADAVKIYKFLLQNCSASPLADDMRRGLDEAERRLARAPAPTRS